MIYRQRGFQMRRNRMHNTLDRRRFLRHVAAAAAVVNGGSLAAGKMLAFENDPRDGATRADDRRKSAMLPIVDTHQHLWDLSKFHLPWHKEGSPLARSFLMSDYLSATAGLNVTKAVYMEVDLAPEQQTAEAQYVLDICKRGN